MGALSKHKRGGNSSTNSSHNHTANAAGGLAGSGHNRTNVRKQNDKRGNNSSTQRPQPQVCVECGETVLDLAAHLQNRHGHVCPHCKKRFGNKMAWHNHMRDVHNVTGKALAKTKIDEWLEKTSAGGGGGLEKMSMVKPRSRSGAAAPGVFGGSGFSSAKQNNPKLAALHAGAGASKQQGGANGNKKKSSSTRTLRRARSVSFGGAADLKNLQCGRFACLACDDQELNNATAPDENEDAPLMIGHVGGSSSSSSCNSKMQTPGAGGGGISSGAMSASAFGNSFAGASGMKMNNFQATAPVVASSSTSAAAAAPVPLFGKGHLQAFNMQETDFFQQIQRERCSQHCGNSNSTALPLSQSTQFGAGHRWEADMDFMGGPSRGNLMEEEMGTYSNPFPRIPRVGPGDLLDDDDDDL